MRGTREYVYFLKIALDSAAELEIHLSICYNSKIIGEKTVHETIELCNEVMRLLKTYIQKVTSS